MANRLLSACLPRKSGSDPSVEDRDRALLELRAWYKDWSETARAVIRRKDYLVVLGLSMRRANRGEPEEVDETEVDESEVDEPTTTTATATATAQLPARAATFLRAVGSHAPIRAAMQSAGYGPRDHDEGLRLLLGVCPYATGGLDPAEDEPAREAVASVERWAKTHVGRLRAAVERLHPEALWIFG